MFSKAKNARAAAKVGDGKSAPPSIISTDMRITGDILTAGEVQVDGTVEGDIKCKALVIGPTGTIRGEVDAEIARIHGFMSGQLRAKSVFLASSARMIGDVTHVSLAIEPGAFMDGHCRHVDSMGEDKDPGGAGESLMLTDGSRPRSGGKGVSAPGRTEDDKPAIAATEGAALPGAA